MIKYKTFHDGNNAARNWLLKNLQYHFHFKDENKEELFLWLEQQFGKNLYKTDPNNLSRCIIQNENAVWDFWGSALMFKNRNDFMLFKLRWGGYEDTI